MNPIATSGASLTYPGVTMPTLPAVTKLAPDGVKDAITTQVKMTDAADGKHALNLRA